jgi:hypothetical protein
MEINELKNVELIKLYSDIINILKERGVIRTKNQHNEKATSCFDYYFI